MSVLETQPPAAPGEELKCSVGMQSVEALRVRLRSAVVSHNFLAVRGTVYTLSSLLFSTLIEKAFTWQNSISMCAILIQCGNLVELLCTQNYLYLRKYFSSYYEFQR